MVYGLRPPVGLTIEAPRILVFILLVQMGPILDLGMTIPSRSFKQLGMGPSDPRLWSLRFPADASGYRAVSAKRVIEA